MNKLCLKMMATFLGGATFLIAILITTAGQAFVSPQDYEKMKMEEKLKSRESEKVQSREPVRIQVHQTNTGPQSPPGKAGPK